MARLPGTLCTCQPPESVGAMELLYRGLYLQEITGMDQVTFQPTAGAHFELTRMMLIRAYHRSERSAQVVLAPDSSHGQPCLGSHGGYGIKEVPSDKRGLVDLKALRQLLGDEVAARC